MTPNNGRPSVPIAMRQANAVCAENWSSAWHKLGRWAPPKRGWTKTYLRRHQSPSAVASGHDQIGPRSYGMVRKLRKGVHGGESCSTGTTVSELACHSSRWHRTGEEGRSTCSSRPSILHSQDPELTKPRRNAATLRALT